MDIEFELYVWLIELEILTETNLSYEKTKTLDPSFAQQFKNGVVCCKILNNLKDKVRVENHNLQYIVLKDVTDTVYLNEITKNWDNLVQDLEEHFKIRLDNMTKRFIKKLDQQIICEIYNLIYEKFGKSDKIFQDQLKMLKKQAKINPILPADIVQRQNSFYENEKSFLIKNRQPKMHLQISPVSNRKPDMPMYPPINVLEPADESKIL